MRRLLAGLLLALSLAAIVHAQGGIASAPAKFLVPSTQVVAIRAGRLFDPRTGTMLTNQVILIRGDRIAEVGPSVSIPAGTQTIDLSKATVLPGLIDTHLHVMTGNPLVGPGGAGIGPNGPGPVGFTSPLQYHAMAALVNAQ